MADEIRESVDLRLIDTATLAAEQKKLRELKNLAQKSDGVKKNLSAGVAPTSFEEPSPDRASGILKSDLKAQSRKGAVTGGKTFNEFREAQKKIKDLEKKQKDTRKQIKIIKSDMISSVKDAGSLMTSGMGTGEIAVVASRFGPLGIAVAGVMMAITPMIMEQFKRGRVFSIFLKEKIQARTLTDVDELNQVRSGTKFMTDDLRIVQGAPQRSNTQNLKFEHVRYTAQKLGQ